MHGLLQCPPSRGTDIVLGELLLRGLLAIYGRKMVLFRGGGGGGGGGGVGLLLCGAALYDWLIRK